MNKKTLKTIATGAVITLATVGASTVSADTQYGIVLNRVTGEWQTVNHATGEIVKSEPNETYSSYEEAQASLVTSTVETPITTETPATETTAVEAPKTAADVKPALDAQQAVVDATAAEANQAQADADTADQAVATAEADVATATEAVSDAKANAANATPANIEVNQADQAANLADQTANATETDEVNAEIAAQTETVADAQTNVDTAQAEKDAADADVTAAEDNVKSAQDAISGTGLAEAQANLDQAKADVKTAETNVATATDAVATAKQADTDRQTKIDAATTDVAVKTDAVNTSKAVLTKAQDDVASTTVKLTQITDAVTKAQDALANIDTVTIADLTQFKADKAEGDSDFMTDSGATVIEQSTVSIGKDSKSVLVDIDNLTNEQKISASQLYVQGLTQIRQALNGLTSTAVTQSAIDLAQLRADQYKARGTNPLTDGHIGAGVENLIRLGSKSTVQTEEDLKRAVYNALLVTSFADTPSNWGHLQANLNFSNNIGIAVANINSDYWLVVAFTNDGTPIANPNDPATLQTALTKAQADQAQAQAASDAAKAQLTKASSDYATALEVKTAAEKVLADATATPLQTQVAENNLRLAEIALTNAQSRQADAQKAVDNFSADLATKKAALDDAKAKLADAQAVQASKATALDTAKAELTKQEATLASLNAEKEALLAEKDRLVEEAKALATELKGYLEAPAILAAAKADLSEKEGALAVALAKAETANNALEVVNAKLAEEKAKLADAQAVQASKATALDTAKAELTKQEATLASLNAEKEALLAEKDRLVEEAKALATELKGYLETPAILTAAKADLSEKEGVLTNALAKAETANNALEVVNAKLAEEKAKLAELQDEYNKLKDLEDKAKDNVITVLPDGTVVAVPKDAPTAAEKPGVDAVIKPINNSTATLLAKEHVSTSATSTSTPVTVDYATTFSNVTDKVNTSNSKSDTLPSTGESQSVLGLFGVIGVMFGFGLAVKRKEEKE